MPHPTRLATSLFATVLLFAFTAVAQTASPQPRRPAVTTSHRPATAGTPATRAVPAASAYKGIFEPVNYGQDINFTDAFFVSADVGWVSGEHATLLKTTDGGTTWKAQIGGDPNANEKPIRALRFLDARHGWAISGDGPDRLLRTMDGENWQEIGKQPVGSGFVDYAFTSVRHGILLGGNMGGFFITNDGGRHWLPVAPCQVHAVVQGLARTEDCRVGKLQMLSARSGYAAADWSGGIAFFRTDDAGEHWTSIVNDVADCCHPDFFFTDLDHGVMTFNNGKTYLTSDGARTWHALLSGSVGLTSGGQTPPLRFADPEVGWVVGASPDNSDTFRVSFSTDAGHHWTMSHNIAFPPGPRYAELKFNFPRRDRAYIIGPHGMIYRYRIVPVTYSATNTLDGPMMPAFGAMELSTKADVIRRDIELLRAKLPQPSGTSGAASMPGASVAGNSTFSQSTGPSAQDATDGFVQDTSPASAALGDCCTADLQKLQSDTAGFVTQMPSVTSQYRPLNLIIAGVQLANSLLNQGQNLWNQFRAFKHAANPTAASQALQQLSTALDSVQQTSSTGFQNPGDWFAANAPADFTQDVGPSSSMSSGPGFTGNSSMDASAAQNASPAGAGLQPHSASGANAQNSVNQAVDKAKKVKETVRSWLH